MIRTAKTSLCGGLCCVATILFALWTSETASAQDPGACRAGPAKYRECCQESYRNKPGLGARARAEDIDACMDELGSRDDKRENDEPRKSEKTPAPRWNSGEPTQSPRQSPTYSPAPSQAQSGDRFRRLECATGACNNGCSADEIAVSAFCKPGSTPALYSNGSISCANASGAEWPTAIICAKKQ